MTETETRVPSGTDTNSSQRRRVIVFDFYSPMMVKVIESLKERGVDVVYWADGKKYFMDTIFENKELFPNTVFHRAQDAIAGIPAKGVDVRSLPPIGKPLLERLNRYAAQALLMMENTDFTSVPLMRKVRLLNVYFQYWYGVLMTLKPDAIIFYDAPHMAYKFVVYRLAKELGIKTIIPVKTPVSGRLIVTRDIENYERLQRAIEAAQDKTFTEEDLSPDIKDYYKNQRTMDTYPFYVRPAHIEKNTRSLPRFIPHADALWRNLKKRTFLKTARSYIQMLFGSRRIPNIEPLELPAWRVKLQEKKWKKTKDGFRKEYMQYQQIPDYSKKYIYVPLHNQPECSTNPLGGVFVDQILMIDMLSRALPKDWHIYVKENPLQWSWPRTHAGRFKGYTREVVMNRNVVVVPVETSTFDLIKSAQAVASVISTAAFEGILRGKPALIFGNVCFMHCDGALPVHTAESIRAAIKKIENGFAPDQQKVINFLKVFGDVSLCGYRDYRFKHGEDLNRTIVKDDTENIRSFTDALFDEIVEN